MDLEEVKKIIEEFFEKMKEKITIEDISFNDNVLLLNLKSEESGFLIGERGQNLFFIQLLLKKILIKKIKSNFYLDLDINSYKKQKTQYLKELIREVADEVSLTKKEKEFAPMTPYERRIVHLETAKREDVESYSAGRGVERRVIIKPSS